MERVELKFSADSSKAAAVITWSPIVRQITSLNEMFDAVALCGRCGCALPIRSGRGRPRKYCVACAASGGPAQDGPLLQGACVRCDAEIPRGNWRFCPSCRDAGYRGTGRAWAARKREEAGLPPSERALGHRNKVTWCIECLVDLGRPGRWCSRACQDALNVRARTRQRERDRAEWPAGQCFECSGAFTPLDREQRFCSSACSKRHHDRVACARRRARQIGSEAVDPIAVFERDGWRCQLCRRKTRRDHRGLKTPLSPELDHIIPLARGGDHTYRNTQCLCYPCNSAKGARAVGQLRMF
ncbi:HNH endonuclease [Methylobacterium sp. R2-1]|uniref:HNH endonuclease n=1 Tax=Methylobacterium sp. R2-1 TaxID=2587064 RepID=UPI00181F9B11|nr:hypothetical protein [Methylobacterium sp. R2-1]